MSLLFRIAWIAVLSTAWGRLSAEPKPPAPDHVDNEIEKHGLFQRSREKTDFLMVEAFLRTQVDANRLILHASDHEAIRKLPAYANFCSKDLGWVETIVARCIPRFKESIDLLKEIGKEKLDFHSKETIPVERRWEDFPPDRAQAKKRWRAMVIDNAISNSEDDADDVALSKLAVAAAQGFAENLTHRLKRLERLTTDAKHAAAMQARVGCGDNYGQVFTPERNAEETSSTTKSCGISLSDGGEDLPVVSALNPGSQPYKNKSIRIGERVSRMRLRVQRPSGIVEQVLDFATPTKRAEAISRLRFLDNGGMLERCDVGVYRKGAIDTIRIESENALDSDKTVKLKDITIEGKTIRVISVPSFWSPDRTDGAWGVGTVDQVKALLKAPGKFDAIALDLKNNLGGSVLEAQRLPALFLDDSATTFGNNLTSKTRGKLVTRPEVIGESGTYPKVPLFVLVNSRSASASEMVAGVLKDKKRAVLVGDRTYGKATQMHVYLKADELGFQFTTGIRTTPDGNPYQGTGIVPDIQIPDHAGLNPTRREKFKPEDVKEAQPRSAVNFEKPEFLTIDADAIKSAKQRVDKIFAGAKAGDLTYSEAAERLSRIYETKETPLNYEERQKRFAALNKYYSPDTNRDFYLVSGFEPSSLHGQASAQAMATYLRHRESKN